MRKIKKILTLLGIVLIPVIILIIRSKNKNILCKTVKIEFAEKNKNNYINPNDIKNVISKYYPDITKIPVNKINIFLLEINIKKHLPVKNVEVYRLIDGTLCVEVKQRVPLVRIINKKNQSFYIDEEGVLMPVSYKNPARVIVSNGNIKDNFSGSVANVLNDTLNLKTLKEIYLIAKEISEDKFLSVQTEQIYVNNFGEYELVPRVGFHIVLLGGIERYKNKLAYLKYFYTNILNKQGWNKYKLINLKFENQIVCEKKI